ncbi:MAG: HPP family protein [Pseudomonadota bacterium]
MKKSIRSRLVAESSPITLWEKLRSVFAAFVALLCVGYASSLFVSTETVPLLVASMGASAVLLFSAALSPMSQPWPLVMGHVLSAAAGVTAAQYIADVVVASAAAVALSVLAMYLFRCLHPPGAAAALAAVLGDDKIHAMGYQFLITPVLINVAILMLLAVLINRVIFKRPYPALPVEAKDNIHHHDDLKPLARMGLRQEDLRHALREMNAYLDISEQDLNKIYQFASMHAYQRRMGEIRCADIMSTDIITVEYDTEVEEVWALLRYHKVATLPVIDRQRRVIGTVSLVDILKHADLKSYQDFGERLQRFIRRTPGHTTEKPEVAGHIMTKPVITASHTMHIAELVPLLSDRGLHHIPIVDEERRLVGMITQSDLIAALYAGAASSA